MLLSIFLYTGFHLIFHRGRWSVIIFIGKTIFLTIIFNLWWVIPSLFAFSEAGQETADYIRSVSNFTASTKIWEAFRLMGFWAFRIKSSLGMDHIPYSRFYYQLPLTLTSFLFPLIAFFGLVIGIKRRDWLVFPFMFLIGVFLSKGINQPFGGLFDYVYQRVPIFSIFRNPYSKFTLLSMFSLTVLLGLSWNSILTVLKKHQRLIFTLVLLCLNLLLAFPMITGSSFQDPTWHNTTLDSQHVTVPQYWYDVGQWLGSNDPNARVVQFPRFTYGSCYEWPMGSCSGEPAGRMFLPNPVIKYPGSKLTYRDYLLTDIYDQIIGGEVDNVASVLGFIGAKYVLQQNDYAWYLGSHLDETPEKMVGLFGLQKNMRYLNSFGRLDLYQIDDDYIYPPVYVVDKIYRLDGEATRSGLLIDFDNNTPPATYVLSDFGVSSSESSRSMSSPEISYIRVNPTKYVVSFHSAVKSPFYLIFSNSFSRYWQVKVSGSQGDVLVPENQHFVANGYANGWLISQDLLLGNDVAITITYYPQKYYQLALIVSGVAIGLSVVFLLIKKLRWV